MTRAAAILLLTYTTASAQIPPMPEPSPAPYVAPLTILDEMKLADGAVTTGPAGITYDAPAHLRVALALKLAPRLSDDRAAASWRAGWLRGVRDLSAQLGDERGGRLKAEARVEGLDSQVIQLKKERQNGGWSLGAWLPWATVALLGGVLIGAVAF